MILSFKPQFKQPILDGTKIHTIREDKPNRWKPGMKIHAATGVRTKNFDCFFESECTGIQSISIKYLNDVFDPIISIDGRKIGIVTTSRLMLFDGFIRWTDFMNWFNTDFEGKIIHWTDFRY